MAGAEPAKAESDDDPDSCRCLQASGQRVQIVTSMPDKRRMASQRDTDGDEPAEEPRVQTRYQFRTDLCKSNGSEAQGSEKQPQTLRPAKPRQRSAHRVDSVEAERADSAYQGGQPEIASSGTPVQLSKLRRGISPRRALRTLRGGGHWNELWPADPDFAGRISRQALHRKPSSVGPSPGGLPVRIESATQLRKARPALANSSSQRSQPLCAPSSA